MGNLKVAVRGLAAAIALVSAGCGGGGQTKPSDPPPPLHETPAETPAGSSTGAPSEGPRALKHESLQSISEEISGVVQGGMGGGATIDFASISGNAQKISDGADAILEDAPATLRDEDRVRYEGLKAQLKERASALKVAADAKDKNGTNRSYLQLSRSCTQCHNQFGPPAGEGK